MTNCLRSIAVRFAPNKQTPTRRVRCDAMVESRMGAVAWAMRQRSVSHPRSSNRTCGFPASGSPTGFVLRHTKQITDRKRHLRSVLSFFASRHSLLLKDLDDVSVCGLIANHLHLAFFESIPEVRVLPSTGITRLQRSYYPVQLPPMPPPEATLRPLPSHQTGLPRLPEPPFQRAVPLPRRIEWVRVAIAYRITQPSPEGS